jgi:hypothetical protein
MRILNLSLEWFKSSFRVWNKKDLVFAQVLKSHALP